VLLARPRRQAGARPLSEDALSLRADDALRVRIAARLGTFTVRLFFYTDRYAGTWQHGERGGYISGRIESKALSVIS